jgi:23S rRNA (uridine2552-2'-O)-methyltransferase
MALDAKERLLRRGQQVLDLGAAPGGWSQYAKDKVGAKGRVIAVDRLAFKPIEGVESVIGAIEDEAVCRDILNLLGDHGADLVISDMAPNITGIRSTDDANFEELLGRVWLLTAKVLRPGGSFIVKLFQGTIADEFRRMAATFFESHAVRKPAASRDQSREIYLVLRGFAGQRHDG